MVSTKMMLSGTATLERCSATCRSSSTLADICFTKFRWTSIAMIKCSRWSRFALSFSSCSSVPASVLTTAFLRTFICRSMLAANFITSSLGKGAGTGTSHCASGTRAGGGRDEVNLVNFEITRLTLLRNMCI